MLPARTGRFRVGTLELSTTADHKADAPLRDEPDAQLRDEPDASATDEFSTTADHEADAPSRDEPDATGGRRRWRPRPTAVGPTFGAVTGRESSTNGGGNRRP